MIFCLFFSNYLLTSIFLRVSIRLKEAFLFYKKALNDKDAIACGCLKDAEEWLIDELNKLFEEQE